MKKILFIALALLLFTFFNSCKKNDRPPFFKENCKVVSLEVRNENGNGIDYDRNYTYDKNGNISSEFIETRSEFEGMGTIVVTFKYDYIRDKNGHIISVLSVVTDPWGVYEDPIEVIYDNKGEKIIKLVESSENEVFREYNFKYNWKGLISESTVDYPSPDLSMYNQKSFFEYNAIGQVTKKTLTDYVGDTSVYSLYEPKGITASNEGYLIEHGLLPIDLTSDDVLLPIVDGGIGSVEKVYHMFIDNVGLRMDSKSNRYGMSGFSRGARRIGKSWSTATTKPNRPGISLRQPGGYFVLWATITLESVTLNQRGYPESRAFGSVDMNGGTNKKTELYQFDCSRKGWK